MSELESHLPVERSLLARALAFFVLLAVEYSVVALRFDGLMHRYAGPWQQLTFVVTFSALGLSGVLLLRGRQVFYAVQETLREQCALPGLRTPLVVHLLAYGALLAIAELAASRSWPPAVFAFLVVSLVFAGSVSMLALLRGALSFAALRKLTAKLQMPLLWGAVAGLLAFVAGNAVSLLWFAIARVTLLSSARILTFLGAEVDVLPDVHLLAMDGFIVEVAKECSGIEGMGLIAMFLSLYLWSDRARLRFPQAFFLLPLGIAAMYLANLARIVALVWVGARVSPAIALGGFHSKAGWVFFCAVALTLIFVASRWSYVAVRDPGRVDQRASPGLDTARGENDTAIYLMPLLAIVATSLLTSLAVTDAGLDRLYGLRLLAAGACLWYYRRPLRTVLWRRVSGHAPLLGVMAFGLWLWLSPAPSADRHAQLALSLHALSAAERSLWIALRVCGAVLTVPIAEELAFRGYLYRRLLARDFASVPWDRLSWGALVLSSLAFGFLHSQYLAGSLVGGLYALAMFRRASLLDTVVAHAVTNGLLSAYVLNTGQYGYW